MITECVEAGEKGNPPSISLPGWSTIKGLGRSAAGLRGVERVVVKDVEARKGLIPGDGPISAIGEPIALHVWPS